MQGFAKVLKSVLCLNSCCYWKVNLSLSFESFAAHDRFASCNTPIHFFDEPPSLSLRKKSPLQHDVPLIQFKYASFLSQREIILQLVSSKYP